MHIEKLGIALAAVAAAYAGITLLAVMLGRARRKEYAFAPQPVSVLKPLHGDEPHLYENLRSFCVQDFHFHPIILGVPRLADPAPGAPTGLQGEFPPPRTYALPLVFSEPIRMVPGCRFSVRYRHGPFLGDIA